jgi:two-component system chemotaxis sensor kinase CheA
MSIDISQFRGMFFEEARDYVATFESAVLTLEREPTNTEAIHEMFRAAHSLKGCSATLGVDDVASFTHVLENLLDRMREGTVEATSELIELLLAASDVLGKLLKSASQGLPPPRATEALVRKLSALQVDPKDPTEGQTAATPLHADRFLVDVVPEARMLVDGLDPLPLLRELHELGTVASLRADTSRLPLLDDLDAEMCYLSWSIVMDNDPEGQTETSIREVFEFVEDVCKVSVTNYSAGLMDAADEGDAASLIQRTTGLERGGAEQATLRVATERVDEIINLVGELVIAQAGLTQAAGASSDECLVEAIGHLGRTLHELQQCALAVRTLPLTTVFCRFPRLVRDLAAELGKEIRLDVVGGETELDKSVIEGLASPLTHILRNALDHGIETPDVREAAGKPREGVLRIKASQQHGSVVIDVQDDGAGLDPERILAIARARGLVDAADDLSSEQVLGLIFEPGFSTAERVSDVSGRGVGMDAARTSIEALNGSLQVQDSSRAGTTLRITLPLTLAILDGFAVETCEQTYIVPLMSVLEVVRPAPDDFRTVLGRGELISIRGETLPLLRLRDALQLPSAHDEHGGLVVVVDAIGGRYGLLVDDVDGQVNVVIKGLDESVRKNPAILGGTIRGDGSIAFILDLAGIVRLHHARSRVRATATIGGE